MPSSPLVAVAERLTSPPPPWARALADGAVQSTLDLTGPAAVRPFVVHGLVRARAHRPGGHRDRRARPRTSSRSWPTSSTPTPVAYYPSWETLPHERLSPRSDTVGRRLAVLRRLRHPGTDATNGPLRVVVAPVRTLLQPQVTGLADLEPVELVPGETRSLDDVVRGLADAAYTRVDLVEKRGEFAVRGGIVDVFPPTEEHPLRVEFWGDDVEEIRSFSVADQRTLETVERLWAPPCRELLLTDDVRRRARRARRGAPAAARAHRQDGRRHRRRGHGVARPGARRLDGAARRPAARATPPCWCSTPSAPAPAPTTWSRPARSSSARAGRRPPAAAIGADRPRRRVVPRDRRRPRARPRPRPRLVDGQPVRHRHATAARTPRRWACRAGRCRRTPAEAYRGDLEQAVADIRGWLADGPRRRRRPRRPRPGRAHRRGAGRARRRRAARRGGRALRGRRRRDRHVRPPRPRLRRRPRRRVAVVTGEDLSGQKASTRDMRKMPARRKKQIDPLELKAGDYVVHEQHGVGRFVEMKQREVGGATREYLVLEYGASKRGGPTDRLYVPADTPRPGHPLRRRREPQPRPPRRRRLDQAQEPRPQGGPRDRGRADQAVRRPAGDQGPRLRPRHPVAARARGRLPVPARPPTS